ncbi:MAG: hypothetical protein M1132_12330 [Chloroflexi bacterium]|nr:hypothetical protein [Chloroflexota bacterium]
MALWRQSLSANPGLSAQVTEQANTISISGVDELGLPWWGFVSRNGGRLLAVKVEALAATPALPLSSDEAKRWLEGKLVAEDEPTTRAFFDSVALSLEKSFLGAP